MADFTRQRQFKTREATLQVDGGLPPGVHIFELVVVDESGNQSKAVQVKVQIVRTIPVTPVTPVTPVRPVVIGDITRLTPVRPVTPRIP